MRKKEVRIAITALSILLGATPAYAVTPSTVALSPMTAGITETGSEAPDPLAEGEVSMEGDAPEAISPEEQYDLQEAYREYLASLEAAETSGETLSAEEEAAGYQIIGGVKYSPEELSGDANEEVIFGGVQPGTNTGYVNFFTELPEYVHENAYVIVMNLNTGDMYGCRTYEINNFQAQICLPSGIYMISEGGLSMDTTGRFYALNQQFQVKSGGQETVVAKIVDSKPELAEEAYPEQDIQSETERPSKDESGITEKVPDKKAEDGIQETDPEIHEEANEQPWYITALLSLLFSLPCIAVAGYVIYRYLKNWRE